MIRRIVIFLIRKKLGLKKFERFQFAEQKSPTDTYFFTDTEVMKSIAPGEGYSHTERPSTVSLNWLLNDECKRNDLYMSLMSLFLHQV